MIGSRWFAAPEVRNGRLDSVAPSVDIYSLGKILYWLLSGGQVFDREEHRSQEFDLVEDRYLRDAPEEAQARELVNELLDRMIVLDPQKRIKDSVELEDVVRDLVQLVESGARPILSDFPHRCDLPSGYVQIYKWAI